MVDGPHARRIEILAARLVLRESVVGPAVPQGRDDLVEFLRPRIAVLAAHMFAAAKVERVAGIGGRDQIPAGSPLADMVHRGEAAGDHPGLVVSAGRRGDDADFLRHHRDGREQRRRLEEGRSRRGMIGGEQRRAIHVAHAIAVGQEHAVELSALGDLRHLDESLEIHHRSVEGILVAPAPEMAADEIGNAGEMHHGIGSSIGHRRLPSQCGRDASPARSRRKNRADRTATVSWRPASSARRAWSACRRSPRRRAPRRRPGRSPPRNRSTCPSTVP